MWDALPDRWAFLLVLLLMLAIYLPTATYDRAQSVDSALTSVAAWSLGQRGTLDLMDVRDDVQVNEVARGQTVEVGDRLYTNRFPGAIFAGTPFYALRGMLLGPTTGPSLVMGGVAGATLTALAIALLHLVFRRLTDPVPALVAALAVGLGTATWSVSANALWTHGPAQMWLALGMLALAGSRHATAGWAFGLGLLTRPHLGIVAAVVGVNEARESRSLSSAIRIALTTAVGLAVWILYGRLLFGEWTLFGGYVVNEGAPGQVGDQTLVRMLTNLWWMVAHPIRGFLPYTACILWLVPALPSAWRNSERWVRSSAIASIAYLLAHAYINRWSGGDTYWSYRYPIETLTLLAPLLLVAYMHVAPARRRIVHILLGVSIALQFPGAVLEYVV